jgi:type 1 glutamine amidotransferase
MRLTSSFAFAGLVLAVLATGALAAPPASQPARKVVFLPGRDSHGFGSHAHTAGCQFLAKCLNESGLPIQASVLAGGFPADEKALDGVGAIVIYCDGGGGHLANKKLKELGALLDKGVGLACLHYAVEVPKGESGERLLDWIGGYFEINWSVNPFWTAQFTAIPVHPLTRGVKPFAMRDEWYYHMRFRDGMKGVTPLLSALPGADTLTRKDGPHENNPHVRAAVLERKEPQHLAWASVRQLAGGAEQRGFGCTGGHEQWGWAQDDYRTTVLNGIAWIAGLDVPEGGVPSKRPTLDQLIEFLPAKPPANFDKAAAQKKLDALNAPATRPAN